MIPYNKKFLENSKELRKNMTEEHAEADRKRDILLSEWGIKVLRYPNASI